MTRDLRLAAALLALLPGCSIYFGDDDNAGDDDGSTPPDAAPVPDGASDCLPESSRTSACLVDLAGTLVDWETQQPLTVPLELRVTTAWDSAPAPLFPGLECQPLDILASNASGMFAGTDLRCDSPLHPPIVLIEALDDPSSPLTANIGFDYGLSCNGADCATNVMQPLTLPVPSTTLANAWRAELATGGMPDAATRGLVLMQFKEQDGSPSVGVVPSIIVGGAEQQLTPGVDMRFIAADRATLVRFDAATTGASGLAIIALPPGVSSAYVVGRRSGQTWAAIGVLEPPTGFFFFEDRTVSM